MEKIVDKWKEKDEFNYHLINESEKRFKEFCDKKSITAIFLHQSPTSFSKNLRDKGGKRPDFKIITLFGEFYVDVKTSRLKEYTRYTIDLADFRKLKISEKILHKSIYLAYPIDPWYKGKDWGFISLQKVQILKNQQVELIEKGYKFIGIDYNELSRINELL